MATGVTRRRSAASVCPVTVVVTWISLIQGVAIFWPANVWNVWIILVVVCVRGVQIGIMEMLSILRIVQVSNSVVKRICTNVKIVFDLWVFEGNILNNVKYKVTKNLKYTAIFEIKIIARMTCVKKLTIFSLPLSPVCLCDQSSSEMCDHRTGTCLCKANIVGQRCDQCAVCIYFFNSILLCKVVLGF